MVTQETGAKKANIFVQGRVVGRRDVMAWDVGWGVGLGRDVMVKARATAALALLN